jgi:VWFA-related protein
MRPALVFLVCSLTAFAQQPPVHVEPPVYVTAIDVIADVRDASGKLPEGLTPADFILTENGVEREIIGVDYLRAERLAAMQPGAAAQTDGSAPAARRPVRPWQTVLYFETDLSNARSRRQAAEELIKQADKLVQIGTVDVILADPRPAPVLQNSRDAEAVRKALKNVIANAGGANQIALHRMQFMKMTQTATDLEALKTNAPPRYTVDAQGRPVKIEPPPDPSNMSARITAVDLKIVRPYIEQEVQLVNRFRKNLIGWMSNYGRYAPRTLFIVTDGYDLDPLEYYSANLNKGDQMELQSYVSQAALKDASGKMARALASAGWATVSIQGSTIMDGWIDDASTAGAGRVQKFSLSTPQTGARAVLIRPIDPLMEVAVETGGDVVVNSGKIAQAIDKIDDRLRITYQVSRKPDGKALPIELKARNKNLKVRAARWAAAATPDEMSEQRALGQLHEPGFTGDLSLDTTVEWSANTERKQGMLRVAAKVPGFTRGDFRFTLAVLVPPSQAFVTNRHLEGYQLSDGEFRLRTPLDLPAGTSVVVISIEEMSTGMWGSSRIKVE